MRLRSFSGPLLAGLVLAGLAPPAPAKGLLVPADPKVPPLAVVNHTIAATVDDQVAVTTVEQTFRNHTDRPLEATFVFPVPRGASVTKFALWIDGKETSGELLDAKKAHQIYTDIVRRTQDPGLLEYLGNDLMRMRVFPVPARGDQKVKVTFTAVAPRDGGAVEYLYPMKADALTAHTAGSFSARVTLKSRHPIQNVYSPTHAIDVTRAGDREATVTFTRTTGAIDKDFQLFYGVGGQEVGLTPLTYRPVASEDGYFLLLISPELESMKTVRVPRDLVLVLDTSGSMSDLKLSQAKKALRHCLSRLGPDDRFGVVSFATAVRTYRDELTPATDDHLDRAGKWVNDLRTSGGTAIWPALDTALGFRGKDDSRAFTVVFFTDGQPTVDETNPEKIVKNVAAKNSANTRVFTFGVGDDVNAAMLDQLADTTRAVSTYVRPAEDIEAKASGLYAKISHPVMTNVRLAASGATLHEVYPPRLPDLFHGGQLVVLGRYAGSGTATVKLTGLVGKDERELAYEVNFPARTDDGREFVEQLWGRRKVGYLLDQIRVNGESKELVEEVTALAKKYGIATPYTSHLVVPDGPLPVIHRGGEWDRPRPVPPPGLMPLSGPAGGAPAAPAKVEAFARELASKSAPGSGGIAGNRADVQEKALQDQLAAAPADKRKEVVAEALKKVQEEAKQFNDAKSNYNLGRLRENQAGKLGVDLAQASQQLREQSRVAVAANAQANGRSCVDLGGVWVDESFKADTKAVTVKAQGNAYFRILEKQPKMKDVFRLGNHLVWLTPSGTALVVDANDGADELPDAAIDALFAAAK